MEWNVTADIQGLVNGAYTDYGWRIKDPVESDAAIQTTRFNTRENSGTAYNPQLVITYTP